MLWVLPFVDKTAARLARTDGECEARASLTDIERKPSEPVGQKDRVVQT
jgi:hypothetical protein